VEFVESPCIYIWADAAQRLLLEEWELQKVLKLFPPTVLVQETNDPHEVDLAILLIPRIHAGNSAPEWRQILLLRRPGRVHQARTVGREPRQDFDFGTNCRTQNRRLEIDLVDSNKERIIHQTNVREEFRICFDLSIKPAALGKRKLNIVRLSELTTFPCRPFRILVFVNRPLHCSFQGKLCRDFEIHRKDIVQNENGN
jgi:hypothetical protein